MQRDLSRRQQTGTPLLFYGSDQPYFEFTNAASYPITFRGQIYPTAEHLYNARKFLDGAPNLAERIRNARSPRTAIDESIRLQKFQRADWSSIKISVMEEVLEAKFTQHSILRSLLLGTGDRELIDTSPLSAFWGIGKDGLGRNELGKILMRLRQRLRNGLAAEGPPPPPPAEGLR
ncbi:NADAR family protein [Phanerochaete sordida]|uniref:NADAR family protein n=1 Tax=Phanerochaete sordida TaxID=48140 RepID=A0A9P3GK42_9APHY|nr:NADAR family protein [Phanerochaete sordida]